jgi:hypothetical protein
VHSKESMSMAAAPTTQRGLSGQPLILAITKSI